MAQQQPSAAQKAAGNYPKGHDFILGMRISTENPKGSVRSGTDKDGNKWAQKLEHDYGYIRGTQSRDKGHMDVFIGSGAKNPELPVHVVDQQNEDGTFDEHKVMLGFPTAQAAAEAYHANYEPGWRGLQDITPLSLKDFKAWAFADGRRVKDAGTHSVSRKALQEPEAAPPPGFAEGGLVQALKDKLWGTPEERQAKLAQKVAAQQLQLVERLSTYTNGTSTAERMKAVDKYADGGAVAFGNPNLTRQGRRAGATVPQASDYQTVHTPLSAALAGLMGTPPDELSGSVLDPLHAEAKAAAELPFLLGSLAQLPLGPGARSAATLARKGAGVAAKVAPALQGALSELFERGTAAPRLSRPAYAGGGSISPLALAPYDRFAGYYGAQGTPRPRVPPGPLTQVSPGVPDNLTGYTDNYFGGQADSGPDNAGTGTPGGFGASALGGIAANLGGVLGGPAGAALGGAAAAVGTGSSSVGSALGNAAIGLGASALGLGPAAGAIGAVASGNAPSAGQWGGMLGGFAAGPVGGVIGGLIGNAIGNGMNPGNTNGLMGANNPVGPSHAPSTQAAPTSSNAPANPAESAENQAAEDADNAAQSAPADASNSAPADASNSSSSSDSSSSSSSSDSSSSSSSSDSSADAGGSGDGGGDGCYITTATERASGKKDDNAYELRTLRKFRDGFMMKDAGLAELVQQYRSMAPDIVAGLNARPDSAEVYKQIHKQFIVPASRAVSRGDNHAALNIYADMVAHAAPLAAQAMDDASSAKILGAEAAEVAQATA